MKVEVHSAADFLINLLRVKQAHSSLPEHVLQRFNQALQTLLVMRFNKHWYPDRPTRGSAYRCIRINGKMDPLVAQAGAASGMAAHTLRKMLPTELTLWIDPDEVAYRIGENGSICVLYDSESARNSPSSEDGGGAGTGADCAEFIMERKMRLSAPCAGDATFHLVNGVMRAVGDYRTPSPVMMPVSSSSASSSAASSPPQQQQQQQHQRQQQQHHQRQMGGVRPNHNVSPGLNSSVSTDSGSSPPMSPQYAGAGRHFQQHGQQQQQQQHRQQQQQQQHQQNVYGVYQWSGSEDNFSPQLRSQC